jgi:hypothetical protein
MNNEMPNMPPIERMADSEYDSRLVVAARNGNVELVRALIREVDPSLNNDAALAEATDANHPEVVLELLKDERVNPSDNEDIGKYDEVFFRWIERGHVDVVKALLNNKHIQPEYYDAWAYMVAIGDNEEMRALLQSNSRLMNKIRGGKRNVRKSKKNLKAIKTRKTLKALKTRKNRQDSKDSKSRKFCRLNKRK